MKVMIAVWMAVASMLCVVSSLDAAPARARTPSGASKSAAADPVMATVGSLRITRKEFEDRSAAGRAEYVRRTGSRLSPELENILDRQVLESLIRANLLRLEARRRGLSASAAEAEVQLRSDPIFQQNGKFDPARYENLKASNPEAFKISIDRIRAEMSARKLNDELMQRYRPEEARVRATAEKALTRANVEYLLLRAADFPGSYPEPRESEILAWYRAHASEYHRPARATLSILAVLPLESSGPDRSGARIRQRADSLLAAIRGGAGFESAAAAFGGLRTGIVVTPGNFPGNWRGDARLAAEVFKTPAGELMSQPVPADNGWLLVRVDETKPDRIASLAEVAREIRLKLRDESRLHHEDRELLALYATDKDSLRADAWKMRYAVIDTHAVDPGQPSASEIERYYRAHLADYSSYDATSASIRMRPLAEVRDEIRTRWRSQQRAVRALSLAEGIERAWREGRRDRSLERQAVTVRDLPPFPTGALVDTGLAGRVLSDSLARRGMGLGAGSIPFEDGLIVYHVHGMLHDVVPDFEQARPLLALKLHEHNLGQDERAARESFEKDPKAYAGGEVIHFTRMRFEPPSILDVPLTRAEVEHYYREHIDKYSISEQVRARHILISPAGSGEGADRVARSKAEDVLRRIRAGEDFAALARAMSDDPPTKEDGGDLGYFGRGAMLDAVERTAFSLQPGEVSEPVKSEVGYHIIQVMDHLPLVARPLVEIYANVGADAATEKAERMARAQADSVLHTIRTAADGRAAARKMNIPLASYTHTVGYTGYPPEMRGSMMKLERVRPGQLYPGVEVFRGVGCVIQWVDSTSTTSAVTWENVRAQAIDQYRAGAGRRALEAKRAELDSLMRSGWGFDSLATLWGGPERIADLAPGAGLPKVGGIAEVDSVIFGGRRAPALSEGEASDWIGLPNSFVRLRLVERKKPSPNALAGRIEAERRMNLEFSLYGYYEELKHRYAVRILDPELRGVNVPPPPEPASL